MAIARFDSALARLLLNLSVTAVSDLRSDANPPTSFCLRGPRSSPERGFDFMGYGIGYLARGTARPARGAFPEAYIRPSGPAIAGQLFSRLSQRLVVWSDQRFVTSKAPFRPARRQRTSA
jgi:hypothetical protein